MKSFELYSHAWKSFIRNERWRRSLFSRILYGILFVYFALIFLFLGSHIDELLIKAGGNPINRFNSVLIWYLLVDFLLRSMLQSLPTLDMLPYLRLRLRRSRIIRHLLFRSLFNVFNLVPWFLVVPFVIKVVVPVSGYQASVIYALYFLALVLLNNYLAVFIGFMSKKKPWVLLMPLGLILSAYLINLKNPIISGMSVETGQLILTGNLLLASALAAGLILVITLTFHFLRNQFYLDNVETSTKIHSGFSAFGLNHLVNLGETGTYLSLEISLLTRNKRPRQSMVMIPFMLIYLVVMMRSESFQNEPFLILLFGVAGISAGASMYGQFIFSWESSYFDAIMARKNNFEKYVRAKYYLMCGMSVIMFIPVALYFYFAKILSLDLLFSFLFYILGVNSFIALYFGTLNDGRIDLSRSQFLNYQGVTGRQLLLNFVIMFLPLGIYKLVEFYLGVIAGELVIALPGITLLVFHRWWMKHLIVDKFMRRKYINLEGFRKLSA